MTSNLYTLTLETGDNGSRIWDIYQVDEPLKTPYLTEVGNRRIPELPVDLVNDTPEAGANKLKGYLNKVNAGPGGMGMSGVRSNVLNQRIIKSAPADLTSSGSMTVKEMNSAPEGQNQIFSGLNPREPEEDLPPLIPLKKQARTVPDGDNGTGLPPMPPAPVVTAMGVDETLPIPGVPADLQGDTPPPPPPLFATTVNDATDVFSQPAPEAEKAEIINQTAANEAQERAAIMAQAAAPTPPKALSVVYSNPSITDPNLVTGFTFKLPANVKPGDQVKNIGSNPKINIFVPQGVNGGDSVEVRVPKDDMVNEGSPKNIEVVDAGVASATEAAAAKSAAVKSRLSGILKEGVANQTRLRQFDKYTNELIAKKKAAETAGLQKAAVPVTVNAQPPSLGIKPLVGGKRRTRKCRRTKKRKVRRVMTKRR
jgi:hypothetical protein